MHHWNPAQIALWILMAAAVGITLLVCVDVVAAEDDSAKSLLAQLADAQKRKDAPALTQVLNMAPGAHNASSTKPMRAKIIAAVAKVAKNKKAGDARLTAIDALGRMDDVKGAFKTLKALFGDATLIEPVIAATGRLAPPEGIPLLAGVIAKSKVTAVRKAAIEALGSYKSSPRRVDAAKSLLDAMARWKKRSDAPPKAATAKADAMLPWQMLAPAAADALKELTGASHNGPEGWLAALVEVKGKVAALFPAG